MKNIAKLKGDAVSKAHLLRADSQIRLSGQVNEFSYRKQAERLAVFRASL